MNGLTTVQPTSVLSLLVRIGADRYAVRADAIREVCQMGDLVRVPRAPDFVLGVANRHGRIFTIIDIAYHLHIPRVVVSPESLILVLVDAREVGFVVDAIEAVEEVPGGAIESVLTSRGTAEKLNLGAVLTGLERFFD